VQLARLAEGQTARIIQLPRAAEMVAGEPLELEDAR